MGKEKATSINGAALTGNQYVEKWKIFVTLHKPQVHVDQNLNIKPDTLNIIEEKVGKSFELIGTGVKGIS